MGFWFRTWECARHDVGEPVAETTWRGIDGCVGIVDADAFEGESEEGLLLRVGQGKGFEASEYDGICSA